MCCTIFFQNHKNPGFYVNLDQGFTNFSAQGTFFFVLRFSRNLNVTFNVNYTSFSVKASMILKIKTFSWNPKKILRTIFPPRNPVWGVLT
jgi:hypothetical protein